jgi:hypothetical protein
MAGRVADLGIGTACDGPTPTTESLSAALRTTLRRISGSLSPETCLPHRSDGRGRREASDAEPPIEYSMSRRVG